MINKIKMCTKCGRRLPATPEFFYRQATGAGGLTSKCKGCKRAWGKAHRASCNESSRRYRERNPTVDADYYISNRLFLREMGVEYRRDNPAKAKAATRRCYVNNKEHHLGKCREWAKNNPEKVKEYGARALRKKRSTVSGRVEENLRDRLRSALRGVAKASTTKGLLGCTVGELRKHLSAQFTEGMTWDNYGHRGWHIDHIKPCACFDLGEADQQRECFHYTNLQPLWATDNLRKGAKFRDDK